MGQWLNRGFWTVVDQAFFAGTNFIVNVLLARWLEAAPYGAFSTAYSVFLLLMAIHAALWTEPMLIYGGNKFAATFPAYQRILVKYHWNFGILIGFLLLLFGAGSSYQGHVQLAWSFVNLAFAAPLILYLWLVRREAYVVLEPRIAAFGGAIYLFFYVGCIYLLFQLGWLSGGSALLLMGLTAYVVALWVSFQLRKHLIFSSKWTDSSASVTEIRTLHWGYGRWSLLAGGLSWVPINWYFVLTPFLMGVEQSGLLRAYLNLLYPVLHFSISFSPLLVSVFARKRSNKQVWGLITLSIGFMWLVSLIYSGLLFFFGKQIIEWLYSAKYAEIHNVVVYILPTLLGSSAAVVLGSLLRAREMVRKVSFVYLINAILTLTIGSILLYRDSLWGFAVALAVVQMCSGIMFLMEFTSTIKEPVKDD